MKKIYIVLYVWGVSCISMPSSKSTIPDLKFIAIIKGCFNLPQINNTWSSQNDSIFYFLAEVKLINNSGESVEFVSSTCTTPANIAFDSKFVRIDINNCLNNSLITLKLLPKQELVLPIIFQTNRNNVNDTVRIGWIFQEPIYDPSEEKLQLENSRQKLENVLWSNPIELGPTIGTPYIIK